MEDDDTIRAVLQALAGELAAARAVLSDIDSELDRRHAMVGDYFRTVADYGRVLTVELAETSLLALGLMAGRPATAL